MKEQLVHLVDEIEQLWHKELHAIHMKLELDLNEPIAQTYLQLFDPI